MPRFRLLYIPVLGVLFFLSVACSEDIDPAEALREGQELLQSGDLAAAIIQLKNAVQAAPEDAQARLALGRAYLENSDSKAALKELRRARSLGLSSDDINRSIVEALLDVGSLDDAASELALNADTGSADWMVLQGMLDLAVGRL